MSSEPEPSEPEPEPRPKRPKIGIACDMCRHRKVRCDGTRPVCGNCARRTALGDRCIYSGGTPNVGAVTPPPANRISASAASAYVELGPSPEVAVLGGRDLPQVGFPTPTPTQPSFYGSRPAFRSGTESPSSSAPAATPLEPTAATTTATSSMDSMTVVVEKGTHTSQYFGSSSAGSFTRQIMNAIDARMGAASGQAEVRYATGPMETPSPQTYRVPQRSASAQKHLPLALEDDEASLVLPRRREADRLVGLYWRYVDPLYPFLERQTWVPAYEALFAGAVGDTDPESSADDRLFVSTLNVIFALSTQLSEGFPSQQQLDSSQQQQFVRQRERKCQLYFSRAQEMLQSSLWEAGSLETVQFLLLASQYLQSTNNPHQTWMVVGSTIRTAQSLGLHLPDTAVDMQDHQRELRRRLWHGCVLMDRMVSVTHGRPVMISNELCTMVPLPHCTSGSIPRASGQPVGPSLSFFIKSVKLYEIINQAISAFYSATVHDHHPPGSTTSMSENDELAMLLKLDEELVEWERGLPDYLYFNMLNEMEAHQRSKTDCRPRQAVILHIRLLQARILLLRPVTSRFCLDSAMTEPNASKSLRTRIRRDVANICVETAKEMISVLGRYQPRSFGPGDPVRGHADTDTSSQHIYGSASARKEDIGLLPAWWYRVYYLYSAASILVVAKLRPDVFVMSDVQQAWDEAMLLLEKHKRFGLAAHRCVAALDILGGQRAQQGQCAPRSQAPGGQGSESLFVSMRAEAVQHPQRAQSTFSDFDLSGLLFDAQDLSDLNMHAWEILNQS